MQHAEKRAASAPRDACPGDGRSPETPVRVVDHRYLFSRLWTRCLPKVTVAVPSARAKASPGPLGVEACPPDPRCPPAQPRGQATLAPGAWAGRPGSHPAPRGVRCWLRGRAGSDEARRTRLPRSRGGACGGRGARGQRPAGVGTGKRGCVQPDCAKPGWWRVYVGSR